MIAKRATAAGGTQASVRHHYVPVFYSKRWRAADRKLCVYSRPYDKIHSQRVFPVQTGFVNRLYEKKGVPKSIAQQVEDEFLKPVDTFAAEALTLIETDFGKIEAEPKYRSAWSLFLITLMTRMPEDLAVLSQILADDWKRDLPLLRKKYASNKKPGDPETIEEFIEVRDPDHMARWAMNVLPNLMDHEGIGQSLNGMRWFSVTTPEGAPRLLTSDRPLFMSKMFSEPECYLTLPIGPHRLFVAATTRETECHFKNLPPKELVEATNLQVVKQAAKYVYGADDADLEFVDKHISSERPQTLMEKLRDHRKQKSTPQS